MLRGAGAHRPIALCKQPFQKYNDLPLGIHHYYGSWESFQYREDARKGKDGMKTYEAWAEYALSKRGGADDDILPWMAAFYKVMGRKRSAQLLRGAGNVHK